MSRHARQIIRLGTAIAVAALAACSGSEPAAVPATSAAPATTPAAPAPTTSAVAPTTSAPTAPSSTSPPASTSSSTTSSTTSNTSTITASTAPTSEPAASPAPSIRSLIDSGAFVRLAHAGGDQEAPHSTMFAFASAVAAGATALELDVQLTADGTLVVQHDDTVDKTTDATGPVAELTLAEIQSLDNAYWFSPECWPCQNRPLEEYVYRGVRTGATPPPEGFGPDDFRVPTFREVAEAFPSLPLDIEIKGSLPAAADVAEVLASEILELGRTESTIVVSFDDAVVDAFHDLAPEVAVSPGLTRLTAWFLGEADLEPHFEVLQLPPSQGGIEVINADVVDRIHAEGRTVWVWMDDASTQENADFYAELVADGVDGIIAGRPSVLTAVAPG